MTRKIKALGVKMVLSGEGADEIFGGYLYFHKAPNKEEFHRETVRKVLLSSTLHTSHSFSLSWVFLLEVFIWKSLVHDCKRVGGSCFLGR